MKKTILIIILGLTQHVLLAQACLPEGITFSTQAEVDNFQSDYPGCTSIEGDVHINGTLYDLSGLSVLTSIEGVLWCINNDALLNFNGLNNLGSVGGLQIGGLNRIKDLAGFDNLSIIEGLFNISFNDSVINFSGLNSLTYVGSDIMIGINPELTAVSGLENLESAGGTINIHNNHALSDISSLGNLISINGGIYITDNDNLENLSGLDHIAYESITGIAIYGNELLSACEVQSICNYIASPDASVEIHTNFSGCMSQSEVAEACLVGIADKKPETEILIHPNPARSDLYISCANGVKTVDVIIYNPLGEIVLVEKGVTHKMDVSKLEQGLYVIELQSHNMKTRKKLIIKK